MTPDSRNEYMRAMRLLPPSIRSAAALLPNKLAENAEEFRLRTGRKPTVVALGGETELETDRPVQASDLQMVMEIATRASAHSYADSIRQGFVTAEGGCRVGLCGCASVEDGKISTLRRLSSLCIRIPREKRGCAENVLRRICRNGFKSTLIISPPGGGKTTLLRELIRLLSDGGFRVALEDERSEVAGTFEGMPCFDVGKCTDVLTGAPKSEGIYLLLRSMAPQIIAFDEITVPEDVTAAEQSANCGVDLLATAHGSSLESLCQRELYAGLMEKGIFKRAVIIENYGGKRTYKVEELT